MNEDQKKIMGQRLKTLREKLNLSQDDLANLLDMSRTNISNYESGRTVPPGNVVSKLAEILKTNSDYILVRTDDPTPTKNVIPTWATSKDIRDFEKFLESEQEIMFHGVPLDDEDKAKIKNVLEFIFWDAKKKNKRKKIDTDK